jgi:hypothetical protein
VTAKLKLLYSCFVPGQNSTLVTLPIQHLLEGWELHVQLGYAALVSHKLFDGYWLPTLSRPFR